MPATAARLADLHAALDRFWAGVDQAVAQPPDAPWRLRFATAVAEIGANIVRHAHPAGATPGPMRLRLRAFPTCIEARFTDHGLPFAAPARPDASFLIGLTFASAGAEAPDAPHDPLAGTLLLPESGYGLLLVRAAVDELAYSRTPSGRNYWRLVKQF